MHNLSTISCRAALDNLWVICGSPVNNQNYTIRSDVVQSDIPENYKKPASF